MSVRVGVRVRPFNQREKELNCSLCVDMMGATTRLFKAEDPEKFRDFTFDYSFWSHDQFEPNEAGYFERTSQKYADQRHVYEQVGQQILSNAWEGYHCCLFAYGQTGAGKSYSMIGYGANKGIVPISCQQIFNRISHNDNPNKEYEVQVSMLEIYNERVQDLLIPINKRQKQGFKIRQSTTLGIYVEGLSKHYVDTYDAIQRKMDEGNQHRSIAATEMNASSSRAHTIISIEFRQKEVIEGKKREKLSVIHLVDLAGSEKVGKTGATGDRLKQAAGINKSLSTLGLVIERLADQASGKKGMNVPYRDSCLTRILQNALGGNSKTLMICAISPASDNYEETLSTLRYADQAKKIKNKAVINESETDKVIRNLTAEKEQLREKVAYFEQMFKKLSMGLGMDPTQLEQLKDAQEELRLHADLMKNYSMTKEEKIENERKWETEHTVDKVDETKPHLTNLNQDPQLSCKIKYALSKEIVRVGRRGIQPPNDIEIGGLGIHDLHCRILVEEARIYVDPIQEAESEESGNSTVYLNGSSLYQTTELMNYDRLTIGTSNIFVVIIPDGPIRDDLNPEKVTWEFAQNELYLRKQMLMRQQYEEKERKFKEENELRLLAQNQKMLELQRQLEERAHLDEEKEKDREEQEKRLREEQEKLRKEIENSKKKMKDRDSLQREHTKEKFYFEKQLLKTLPKCIQLNLIAKEFKRNISMSVKMLMQNEREEEIADQNLEFKRRSIRIKVVNRDAGYIYLWDIEKLQNRYYIIKDISQKYFQTGVIPVLSQKEDPFWDPPEHVLIGRAFLTTKALSYLFDNETTLSIIGEDDHCGEITVNMVPTDDTGQRNLSEEMEDEEIEIEPQDLIGKEFYYKVIIKEAVIPANFEQIYVEYSVKVNQDESQVFKTQEIIQRTKTPCFNYSRLHKFECITHNILEHLKNAKIVFKIYGHELVPIQKKEVKAPPIVVSPKQIDIKPKTLILNNHPQTKPHQAPPKPITITTGRPVVPTKIETDAIKNKVETPKKPKKSKDDCVLF